MAILNRIAGHNIAAGVPGIESVDVGFCQDMAAHHQLAVTMAAIARGRSTDIEVRGLAFDIEGGQMAQIGMMTGWLNICARPANPDSGRRMTWMPATGHGHTAESAVTSVTTMPGMASTEELSRLRKLSGAEFDVYFLQLMLLHHQGGLSMAKYTADRAGVGVVRNLADKIVRAQTHQTRVMTDMLAERGAEPLGS